MPCAGSRSRRGGAAPAPGPPPASVAALNPPPDAEALAALRERLLAARERRAARIDELASANPGGCTVVVSVSIPGADKNLPGVEALLALGVGELAAAAGRARPESTGLGTDPLGPWAALHVPGAPERVKSLCVEVEERHPWGRLLDLDVYHRDGGGDLRQFGRAELGAPTRACLVCGEPARECILLRRHPEAASSRRTRELLAVASAGLRLRRLADALVRGARAELDLTPKPGLVDRHDNGSHPDLSYELMRRSIELLPIYHRDLIEILERAGMTVERGPSADAPSDGTAIPGRALDDPSAQSVGAPQ